MPYLEVRLKISLQLYVLKLVSIVYLEELQLGPLLEFNLVIPRSVIWESLYMFSIERQVSLVLRRDLSRLIVRLRILVVYELVVSGRNEGRFECGNPFHELGFSAFVDRDDGDLEVRPRSLLSFDP
jgi:hypothetical protein